MLSSLFSRGLYKEAILEPLRDSARAAASQLVDEGMKSFFIRWSQNIFNEGSAIKDPKEFDQFSKRILGDIDMIKRQALLQKLYQDVQLNSESK